jgi:hypothetical protein
MRPDPYANSYDLSDPQSLNRYSYVRNSPLAYVDPLGLECVVADRGGNTVYVIEDDDDDDNPVASCAAIGGSYVDGEVTSAGYDSDGYLQLGFSDSNGSSQVMTWGNISGAGSGSYGGSFSSTPIGSSYTMYVPECCVGLSTAINNTGAYKVVTTAGTVVGAATAGVILGPPAYAAGQAAYLPYAALGTPLANQWINQFSNASPPIDWNQNVPLILNTLDAIVAVIESR